jgi:hypothetical protein
MFGCRSRARMRRSARNLERDALIEGAVGALGEVDGAHATTREQANRPVRSDAFGCSIGGLGCDELFDQCVEATRFRSGLEQRLDFGAQCRILARDRVEERCA